MTFDYCYNCVYRNKANKCWAIRGTCNPKHKECTFRQRELNK